MISLYNYRAEFEPTAMEKYAGTKFYLNKCIGKDCKREGEHSSHFWYDETLVIDSILIQSKKRGEFDKRVWIPIRFYNFCFAVSKIALKFSVKITGENDIEIIKQALEYAKKNCFDPNQEPNNMAATLGFKSYSKFMAALEDSTITE